MVSAAGVRNGVFMVSAFEEKNELYFYDPGLRLQGEAPDLHVERRDGLNHCEFLLQIATEGETLSDFSADENRRYFGATLWFLIRPGKIRKISGLDKIKSHPSVFNISQRYVVGDVVSDEMSETEGQVFARVYLSADDPTELENAINSIPKNILILSDEDTSMLIDCDYTVIANG
jgi:hypothetical protein